MQLNFKKDVLPHLVGIAIFYAIVVVYFAPVVLQDQVIMQGDILKWEGSAKEALDFREATGEEALWTNSVFGGMPAYFVSLEFAGDITNALVSVITLGLPHPVNSLFLGMVAMYVLMLTFGVRPAFAIIASVAFALSSYNLLSLAAGHNAKIWAISLMPLILLGIHLAFKNKLILGAAILALGLLLQLKFNHVQITYYTLIISVIYVIVRLIYDWKRKGIAQLGKVIAFLALGAALAVGGNIGRLATALEYAPYSTRGEATLESASAGLDKDYAFSWSNGKLETLTLLVPNFYGGGSSTPLGENTASEKALRSNGLDPAQISGFLRGAPTYWGDQPFTGGPIYGGVILVFLAFIGIWAAPKESLYTFGAIIILSILLSWGKNLSWFNYLLFDILPGYNKFRAVSMALGMTLFAIPALAAISLERIYRSKDFKPLYIAGASIGGLLLLLAVGAGVFRFEGAADAGLPDWLMGAIREDRKAMLSASAWRSLGLIAATFALIYFALKNKISDLILGLGIFALVTIDLWTVNKQYLNDTSFQANPTTAYFAETPADQEIAKDSDYFRVLDLTEGLTSTGKSPYRFHSLGGYHGAKMRRYQDLLDNRLNFELNDFVKKAQEGNFDFAGIQTINMMNTKYVIAGTAANSVFENPEANGPAWIPSQVVSVETNQQEMDELGRIDTKAQATVNTSEYGVITAGTGQIFHTSYAPNELKYQAEITQEGLAVFSEIYYPEGWTATIDGRETDILRTNYLLRGLIIPAGTHEIVFKFEPKSYTATKTPMIIFQYLIVLSLIAGVFFTIKEKNERG
ncbi:membrane protein YfhO [Algoriphagus ratkowskyi]|uniref:Membrane protein YfhO n=1 Tax=Algoriphagus ratkowskyi TaxID=57028 RepID=A0A2W7RYS3_9BACT|nr:YfhO family protein [Algoriphagus ratkowskyi]PZX60377.1 membrane protein YfhO [Algoriphagus ratkowskyi]TXD78191.1 YfhO family protein [Algoriphagus ratkowskyi]